MWASIHPLPARFLGVTALHHHDSSGVRNAGVEELEEQQLSVCVAACSGRRVLKLFLIFGTWLFLSRAPPDGTSCSCTSHTATPPTLLHCCICTSHAAALPTLLHCCTSCTAALLHLHLLHNCTTALAPPAPPVLLYCTTCTAAWSSTGEYRVLIFGEARPEPGAAVRFIGCATGSVTAGLCS